MKPIALTALASALVLLGACASPKNDTARDQTPVPSRMGESPNRVIPAPAYSHQGHVTNIQTVALEPSSRSYGGAVLGAVIGAVAGNQIGDGNGQKAAIAAGAVGGALVGDRIQNRNKREDEVYRVAVRFDDGREASYDFHRIDTLQVGDRVKYESGQLYKL